MRDWSQSSEQIMATTAETVVGLGVKARHAAYVISEYWAEPLEKADWDRRAVRLLIEAVCVAAGRPLAIGEPANDDSAVEPSTGAHLIRKTLKPGRAPGASRMLLNVSVVPLPPFRGTWDRRVSRSL